MVRLVAVGLFGLPERNIVLALRVSNLLVATAVGMMAMSRLCLVTCRGATDPTLRLTVVIALTRLLTVGMMQGLSMAILLARPVFDTDVTLCMVVINLRGGALVLGFEKTLICTVL